MKKLKNAMASVLNVLVIAAILLFILAGLMKIGILDSPEFVKSLLGIETNHSGNPQGSTSDSLKKIENAPEYTVYSAELTPENVRLILSALKPATEYTHDVKFSVISKKSSFTQRAHITKNEDVYCAFYMSDTGNIEKQILRDSENTYINTLVNGNIKTASYPNGEIDFSAETGVIITHEAFFEAADDPQYSFEIKSDDLGAVMLIEFTSVMGNYSQRQEYTLNLDYGIVTEAKCYENQSLIYELTTNSLSRNPEPNFIIPEAFSSYLPDGLAEAYSSASEQQ